MKNWEAEKKKEKEGETIMEEFEKENKKNSRTALIVAAGLVIALIVCAILLVARLVDRGKEFAKDRETMDRTDDSYDYEEKENQDDEDVWEEGKDYTVSKVSFEVLKVLTEDAYLVVEDDLYGITDSDGNWLVSPEYEFVDYYDEELVCFSDYDYYTHVYDVNGKLLDTYEGWVDGVVREDGITYGISTCYMRGMKIELFIGSEDSNYYGVRYYNAETGNLIFEKIGYYAVAVNSLPDETGTAVVISGENQKTIVYRITKDGYTTESFELDSVATRDFYYSSFMIWTERTLSDGWLKTTISESQSTLLYASEWTEILYNIYTNEIVPLPEKYQEYAEFYSHSKGLYYGISSLTEEEYFGEYPEEMYYAVCHGSEVLTEEIYNWIEFDENYIIAGNNELAHIMDYDGNVLAEYKDIGAPFVNGRTLVHDGAGVYFIDENLKQCSDYVFKNKLSYCQAVSVWKSGASYLVKWIGNETE